MPKINPKLQKMRKLWLFFITNKSIKFSRNIDNFKDFTMRLVACVARNLSIKLTVFIVGTCLISQNFHNGNSL